MSKINTLIIAVLLFFPFSNLKAQVDSCAFTQVNVILTTGQWASEMSWELANSSGDIVASGGNYADNSTYSSQYCLDDGCYTLNLNDTFGDGWNGGTIAIEYSGVLVSFPLFLSGSNVSYPFGLNDPDCNNVTQIPGCTDQTAINWNPVANIDDGSCIYDSILFGCTDPTAINWNPIANIDDGSCIYDTVQFGCTDPLANNYNPLANIDDGSCSYDPDSCTFNSITGITVYGGFANETSWSISDENGLVVYSSAPYDNETTVVDNICLEDGCYLFEAFDSFGDGWNGANFLATDENGNVLIDYSLTNGEYGIFNFSVNDSSCVNDILGCTDTLAINFNPLATIDDGSCIYPIDTIYGCTDPIALNYDFTANVDDGSCLYDSISCVNFWVAGAPDSLEFIINTSAGIFTTYSQNDGMFFYEIPAQIFDQTISIEYIDCFGNSVSIQAWQGVFGNSCYSIDTQWCQEILGCTDSLATNYNPWANVDDGSCIYPIQCDSGLVAAELYVCVFSNGQEVGISVVGDDGSIVFEQDGFPSGAIEYVDICLDPNLCYTVNMWNNTSPSGWYNGYYWINTDGIQVSTGSLDDGLSEDSMIFSLDGSCGEIYGCTDPLALNFDSLATVDDGTCIYPPDSCSQHELFIQMHLINNQWLPIINLSNDQGDNIFSGTFWDNNYSDTFCLSAGCYNIEVPSVGAGNTGEVLIEVYVDGILVETIYDTSGDPINYSFGIETSGCTSPILGCTDPDASNYNPNATIDNGSCQYNCDEGLVSAELYVCTFQSGNEVGFSLIDSNGNEVFYQDGFSNLEIAYFDICLDPNECYTATMWNNEGPFGWHNGYYWINAIGVELSAGSLEEGSSEESMTFSLDGSCEDDSLCEAYFEVQFIDTLNGIVYIENLSTGSNLDYFWDFGDGNTSTDPYPEHEYAQDGTYLVCLTIGSINSDSTFCQDTYCDTIEYISFGFLPSPFWINVIPEGTTVGIDDLDEIENLNLYPNPSSEFLNIEFTSKYSGDYIFEILDVSGRIVGQENLNFSGTNIRETIDITRYESGTYLLRIRTDQTSHTTPFSVIR